MKIKTLLALFFVLFATVGFSINVPDPVYSNFKSKFPDSENIRWTKEGKTDFEVEFIFNDRIMSATFNLNGAWIETSTMIYNEEVPVPCVQSWQSAFPEWGVSRAWVVHHVSGETRIALQLFKEKKKMKLVMGPNGNIIPII